MALSWVPPGAVGADQDLPPSRVVLRSIGHRGTAAANIDALTEAIARVAVTGTALGGSLESLEINPLLVDGNRVEALDALVILRDATVDVNRPLCLGIGCGPSGCGATRWIRFPGTRRIPITMLRMGRLVVARTSQSPRIRDGNSLAQVLAAY